ncbi:MAG TPA: lysophospholipid acyltransferase family protein [Desulfobacterales bacterium]|nr:lysophospholipid acyltransferase family protein [Desulfobacterales bacterium]
MRIKLDRFLTSEAFISFFYRLILLYSWTFRLKIENDKDWMDYRRNGGVVLLCTWHQQFFSAVRPFKNYKTFNPSIMISQSRDGEIVAKMALRNGWNPIRGSSSKGGMEALKKMITSLKEKKLAVHIVDGPQGPSGIVKAGAIRLAHAANAVIVPFSVSAEKAWYFNSWDNFLLPKPFSKVFLRFGEMIKFDRVKDREIIERQRMSLEEVMLPALTLSLHK